MNNQNTNTQNIHIIFGGRGGAGEALALELHKQGKRVRVINRSGTANLPAGIEVVKGNLLEPASLQGAIVGASVIYHSASVPYQNWAETLPKMLEGVIGAAKSSGAKLVYVDNLYMYGPNTENISPETPQNPITKKGKLRAMLGNRVLEAHRKGEIRATIVRGSDFFGPGIDNALIRVQTFENVLAGKGMMWVGKSDQPHALCYIADFARATILAGENDLALGKAWVIPTAPAQTAKQYLELISELAGVQPKMQVFPRLMVRLAGLFDPLQREFVEMMYQFEKPFTLDGSSFSRTFGFQPTPYRQAFSETLESVRSSGNLEGKNASVRGV